MPMKNKPYFFLTDAQLRAEIGKCEYCEEKPCREACPADCSPADFIMAAAVGDRADWRRAAALILGSNPLGGVCGAVCPDSHCVAACSRRMFDHPVAIPSVQASIIQRAKAMSGLPDFGRPPANGRRVAIIGAGPSGLGAAAVLAQRGYKVDVFERGAEAGGMCRLIPDFRLDPRFLKTDIGFLKKTGRIGFRFGVAVEDGRELLKSGYKAVLVCTGLSQPLRLGIRGEDAAVDWVTYLQKLKKGFGRGKTVAVVGGGPVAVDCVVGSIRNGARSAVMISLETPGEMRLTEAERDTLLDAGIELCGRMKAVSIRGQAGSAKRVRMLPVILPSGSSFAPGNMREMKGSVPAARDFNEVVVAIGARSEWTREKIKGVFYAGDLMNGPSSVVEAVASGKNAAVEIDDYLGGRKRSPAAKSTKSRVVMPGLNLLPVPVVSEFFGRPLRSPFILSASPLTDGYEQMKKAYLSGWAGGVMKTSFDRVPIHIPGEYMFVLEPSTFGNCDNVSGHSLDRVCGEIGRLIAEFPDRLTLASTGGPVTGADDEDKKVWQSNTRKLEEADAMGIEYSLSCPQGGDGTKGDIVSQDADQAAKIVEWVLAGATRPMVPKLFKLTAAVTAIVPIVQRLKAVFDRYPDQRTGITLANSFPGLAWRRLAWRRNADQSWDDGIVIGLSGESVVPISNLTLARVADLGVTVSGNGGPMNYRQAADFLALGVETVQFCSLPMKHGYGIIEELDSGLSHLLRERGMKSVKELIGCSLPKPVRDFRDLSAAKKISRVARNLCQHCGNCVRCPYLAIALDKKRCPETDASKCIGCSFCVQRCFAGALSMRERSAKERDLLREE